jgi:hypothetical protein
MGLITVGRWQEWRTAAQLDALRMSNYSVACADTMRPRSGSPGRRGSWSGLTVGLRKEDDKYIRYIEEKKGKNDN